MAKKADAGLRLRTDATQFKRGMADARGAMQKTATTSKRSAGDIMVGWGKVAAAGYAVMRAYQATIKPAIEYEKELAKIATLGTEGAAAIPRLREEIDRFAATTIFRQAALAESFFYVQSAIGELPEKIVGINKAANQLAIGGFSDMKTTADILLTTIANYPEAFKTYAEYANYLFNVMRLGRTDLNQMAASFGDVLAQAKASQFGLKEAGLAFAMVTRGMASPEAAATATARMLQQAGRGATENARRIRREYGLTVKDGVMPFLKKLGEVASTLSKEAQRDLFGEIFGIRAIRAISPLLSALKEVDTMLEVLEEPGALERAEKTARGTTWYQMAKAKRELDQALLDVGKEMTPAVIALLPAIERLAGALEWLAPKMEKTMGAGEEVFGRMPSGQEAIEWIKAILMGKHYGTEEGWKTYQWGLEPRVGGSPAGD